MQYEFEIKIIELITVATMSYKGLATQAGKYFPNVFKSIKGKANGVPFICYHSMDKTTGIGEMELCVPTPETPNRNDITIKELPAVKALCITHIGAYDTLPLAYEAMHSYIKKHNFTTKLPWREVFIKGPGMLFKGNPNKYITELVFPLKEGDHYDSN